MKSGKYMLNIKSYDNFDEMMIQELQNGREIEYKAVVKKIPFIVSILPYICLLYCSLYLCMLCLARDRVAAEK